SYDAILRGDVEHPGFQPLLDALKKEDDPRVRAWAASRMEATDLDGSRVLSGALFDVIEKDADPAPRAAAVGSLTEDSRLFVPPDDAVARIERDIRAEVSRDVQVPMIAFLDRYGDDNAVPALDELAAQPSAQPIAGQIAAARASIIARLDEE